MCLGRFFFFVLAFWEVVDSFLVEDGAGESGRSAAIDAYAEADADGEDGAGEEQVGECGQGCLVGVCVGSGRGCAGDVAHCFEGLGGGGCGCGVRDSTDGCKLGDRERAGQRMEED